MMKKTLDRLYGDLLQHDHEEINELSGKFVTLDTEQTISGDKKFIGDVDISGMMMLGDNTDNNLSAGVIFKDYYDFEYDKRMKAPFLHSSHSDDVYGSNVFVGGDAGTLNPGHDATNKPYGSSWLLGIGASTLKHTINAYSDTAVGSYALYGLKNGQDNYALGTASMMNISAGNFNVALGSNTMRCGTNNSLLSGGIKGNATHNISIGVYSLYFPTEYAYNVCIGGLTFAYAHEKIQRNVAVGHSAGLRCQYSANIFLGYAAGEHCDQGNTLIIDNRSRHSADEERERAIIYGRMTALPEGQKLRFNAEVDLKQGMKVNRKTVSTSAYIVEDNDYMLSVKPPADTNILMPLTGYDGKLYEIYAVNLDHNITLSGSINGVQNYSIQNAKDNIRLVYNEDETTWEIR